MSITSAILSPAYLSNVWNVHEATLEGNTHTNNVCEGWNTKSVKLIGHQHPSIKKCTEGILKDCTIVQTIVEQKLVGNVSKVKIKKRCCATTKMAPTSLQGEGTGKNHP